MAESHDIILHRMVLPEHTCPYGLLAKRMLEDAGLPFEDRVLTSREQVDAFKDAAGVHRRGTDWGQRGAGGVPGNGRAGKLKQHARLAHLFNFHAGIAKLVENRLAVLALATRRGGRTGMGIGVARSGRRLDHAI
jgi:hypothetical protein